MHDPMQQNATGCNKSNFTSPAPDSKANPLHRLRPRQARAIFLLLHGCTDAQAAQNLGVDRATIFRWRTKNPDFRAVLHAAQRGLHNRALRRLGDMLNPAMRALQQHLADPQSSLRAAATILRVARVTDDLYADLDPLDAGRPLDEGLDLVQP